VHVQEFTFLSTKKDSMANNQAQPAGAAAPTSNAPVQQDTAANVSKPEQEDDLPF
jgi:single-strand DNA-binding protein